MTPNTANQLVLTAIGEDRPGIVSELTKLVSDNHCNIIDSRIAILGNEFTFIMLLDGDMAAISRVEYHLPIKSVELGLLTMMKRTSQHQIKEYKAGYKLTYQGPDSPGIMSKVTQLMADYHVNIAALKSDSHKKSNELIMNSEVDIYFARDVDDNEFKQKLAIIFKDADVEHHLKPIG